MQFVKQLPTYILHKHLEGQPSYPFYLPLEDDDMSDQNLKKYQQQAEQALADLENTLHGILRQERLICCYAEHVNPDDPEIMAKLRDGIDKIKAFNEEHKEAREAYELECAARQCE